MSIPIFYPIPKTRKGIKILMLILGAVCAGLAVFAGFSWAADQKEFEENGSSDFGTLAQSELKDGMFVHGTIGLAFDTYAETYETNFGVRSSDDSEALYYLVPVYDTNADGTINIRYFVTYEAEPKDFDTMDQVFAQTWSDDPLTPKLTVESAKVRRLSDEFQQYLNEWMNDTSFYDHGSFIDWCVEFNIFGTDDRSVIASKFTPFLIYRSASLSSNLTATFVLAGLAVLFVVIFLVLKFHKAPIKGIIDPPAPDDFGKARDFGGQ